jgi:hypothetical protein
MPTFSHGKSVNVFINEFDFSTYFNDVSSSSSVETAETSAFGTDAKSYISGLLDGTISLGGMFESTTSVGTDEFFNAQLGGVTNQVVIVTPQGHVNGRRAVAMQADNTSYEISGAIGDLVMASAEFQSNKGVDSGVVLSSGGEVTSTGNGTSVDNTLASTNGGVAFLSVPVNTRNGTIAVKVQHSADNSTFADLTTFTTVTSAQKTFGRVEVATGTTVNRYLRVNYTVAGSTGSATPVVVFTRR